MEPDNEDVVRALRQLLTVAVEGSSEQRTDEELSHHLDDDAPQPTTSTSGSDEVDTQTTVMSGGGTLSPSSPDSRRFEPQVFAQWGNRGFGLR